MVRFFASLVLVAYTVTIVFLHAVPTGSASVGTEISSSLRVTHLVHAVMFLPWGVIAAYFIHARPEHKVRRTAFWITWGVVFAFLAEGVQIGLPYRSFQVLDLFFNVTGVLAGSIAILLWKPGCRLIRNLSRET